MSQLLEFAVGDQAWCYGINHGGELTEGKIVHKFQLPGWLYPHYVIEFETHVDPVHEVRSGYTLSNSPIMDIGMWRKGSL